MKILIKLIHLCFLYFVLFTYTNSEESFFLCTRAKDELFPPHDVLQVLLTGQRAELSMQNINVIVFSV